MTKARRGIYAAAISPFNKNYRLEHSKLTDYCSYLLTDGGCDGVAPIGTTGEGASISIEDRVSLPKSLCDAGIPCDRVMVGTGNSSTPDAARISKAALEYGYVNQLVLPPFYYKSVSDDGLYDYFSFMIDTINSDKLRIYLYHFPQVSQVPISVDLVVRLKKEFGPIIAGLKDSSGDFSQSAAFAQATGGIEKDFDVYPSSEAFYFKGIDAGCAGIISGSTNVFATLVQAAIKAPDGPDSKEFKKVVEARSFIGGFNLMAAMKSAEANRIGDADWERLAPPLRPLKPEEKQKLYSGLSEIFAN